MGSRWKEYGLLFTTSIGTPIDQLNLLRDFELILQQAGLQKIRFHELRHTAASIMLKNGIPIVEVSSPLITLALYAYLIPGGLEHTAKLMDDWLTPKLVELEPVMDQNLLH
jgi:integrase